jgi:hypothetical protein
MTKCHHRTIDEWMLRLQSLRTCRRAARQFITYCGYGWRSQFICHVTIERKRWSPYFEMRSQFDKSLWCTVSVSFDLVILAAADIICIWCSSYVHLLAISNMLIMQQTINKFLEETGKYFTTAMG